MGLETAIKGLLVWSALTCVTLAALDFATLGVAEDFAVVFTLVAVVAFALAEVFAVELLAKFAGETIFIVMMCLLP